MANRARHKLEAGEITIPHNWQPREYQVDPYNMVVDGTKKRQVLVWHRRAGKDHLAINMCAAAMFQDPGIYWHVLPTYAQGEKAIWGGMDNDGAAFTDFIPPAAVETKRNDKMLIKIFDELGGSQYRVIGGDNPDRIVGGNPKGVVFSEYSLMNPLCWELVRPILTANGGWAIFIFTPRGYNHGWEVLQSAKGSEKWHWEVRDIRHTRKHDGTPVVTEEDVEEEVRQGMPEELARQEYYCDFTAQMVGAYYGRQFDAIDNEGRCTPEVKWRKNQPVYTSWDLGVRDTMAIWFYQIVGDWVNYIDYMSGTGAGVDYYIKELDKKPYVYKTHYAPHDVKRREVGTGMSVMATAASLGLRFHPVPRTSSVEDDINACRLVLDRARFNSETCDEGLKCLRAYRREWNARNRVWSAGPVHDWTSHGADAFRTGAMMMPRILTTVSEVPRFKSEPTFNDALREHDEIQAERGGQREFKRL